MLSTICSKAKLNDIQIYRCANCKVGEAFGMMIKYILIELNTPVTGRSKQTEIKCKLIKFESNENNFFHALTVTLKSREEPRD